LKARIWTALIAVYIAWGSTYLAIRFAVETMPPFLMAAMRFLVAGGILFIWRRAAGDPFPTFRQWKSAAIVGLLMLLGGNGAVVWAERRVVSGVAALLVGAAPLWMVLIDAVRPGAKRSSWQTWLGVLWGFAGIALLVGPSEFAGNGGRFYLPGVGALLLASFLWSAGSLYSRSAALPDSPLLGTSMEMLAGGTGLLIFGSLTGDWSRLNLSAIRLPSILGLIYLIIFGSLVGFAAYTWLLRAAPTPLVSTYAYVNPLVAIFIGNLLAGEPLTPHILLAAMVIISSVLLINITKVAAPKTEVAATTSYSGDD
jgi:drug/metabolite transporter (DMT)-like permease